MVTFAENTEHYVKTAPRARGQDRSYTRSALRCCKLSPRAALRETASQKDAQLGSCSRDPIGYWADLSAYRYVAGQPMKFLDPMGLLQTDVTIGFPEDFVTTCSSLWNWWITDEDFTIDPHNPDWTQLEAFLDSMGPDDCIKNLIFNGHGSPGSAGPIDSDSVTDPNSEIHRVLQKMKEKMCDDSLVDLRHCLCAKGPKGQKFLTDLSITIGSPVRGIDDIYAVNPHGDEYEALPDGTISKICSHGPYKDTYICAWQDGIGKPGKKPDKPKPKPRKGPKPKPNVKKPTIPHPFK